MAAIPLPADDKENPLREDRRLLGRLLGEVIRSQAGEDALTRIERIRQAAVAFRRENAGRAELERLLNALDLDQTMDVVRAFSWLFASLVTPATSQARSPPSITVNDCSGAAWPALYLRLRTTEIRGALTSE